MNYDQLSMSIETYVREFYKDHPDNRFIYHNLMHTEAVVAAAKQIGNHYQLGDQDFFIVKTAAWFHDVGYLKEPQHHEASGAETAEAFLREKAVPEAIISAVRACILATRIPQEPHNQLEAIVCDADLFHLGQDRFKEKNRLMREEKGLLQQKQYSKEQWRLSTIAFLEAHHYHTDYCQMLLGDRKQEHLDALKKRVQKTVAKQANKEGLPLSAPSPVPAGTTDKNGLEEATGSEEKTAKPDKDKNKKKKEGKKEKDNRPDKGIETMFRVTAGNNQKLSNMADNKAHIMISVNSIILSAVISLLLRKLDDHANLAIPTYMIITISMLTIIFSILATRPTIPKGTFTKEDIDEKKTNLLFFGNFYKMNLADYTEGMWKVMEDRDFLYGSLIKDVYAQGVVLGKKYRLLRISYNVFMFGLILSVFAFILASIIAIH